MALSDAEALMIARDTLRGLEADIIRAELLDEPRLDDLREQKKSVEARVAEYADAAEQEESDRLAARAAEIESAAEARAAEIVAERDKESKSNG